VKCGGRERWKGGKQRGTWTKRGRERGRKKERKGGKKGGYLDGDPSGCDHSQTAVVELLKDEVGQEPVRLSIRPR